MQQHKGNTQPAISQEEHASIGGIDAKKTFVFDASGNQITSFGGQALSTIAIGSAATIFAVVNTALPAQASVVLDVGKNYFGLATVDIGTQNKIGILGNATLSDSKGFIGLTTVVQGTGGNATTATPWIIGGGYLETPFTTTTVQAVGTTDVANYRWVSVQITSQGGSSTVTFQGSNDNANWVNVSLVISTTVGNSIPVVSTTAASSYVGPLHFRYFRLNVTGIVSGTTAGTIEFMMMPSSNLPFYGAAVNLALVDNADTVVVSATANGLKTMSAIRLFNGTQYDRLRSIIDATNSVGTGIVAAGLVGQFDDTSPTAITENQFGNVRMSSRREVYTTIRDAAGNEQGVNVTAGNAMQVEQLFSYINMASNTTITAKSGAGMFHSLTINTRGTTSNVIVYDSLLPSGAKIATIDTTLSTTAFLYDVSFATGLTFAMLGSSAADLTASFR